ncbi:MAG: porin [Candidatus Thiodiazotropha sp.]
MAKIDLTMLLFLLPFGLSATEQPANSATDSVTFSSNRSHPPDPGYADYASTRGGVEIVSDDGEFSAALGGRLLLDAAYYDEDKNSLGNGTELRSARLEMEGRIYTDTVYKLSIDFADGDAEMNDAWLAYDAHYPWRFTLGHFKVPFSLEELTSRKHLTFMERALPNALAPGRNMGLGLHWYGEQLTVAAAVFGDDYNDDSDDEGDEGWGGSARLTYTPLSTERSVVHFGLSSSYRKLDDEEVYRVDSHPESHLTDIRYLDTGKIQQSKKVTLLGFEGAWVYGETSLQGEWIASSLARNSEADIEFSGWYLQASWFPTGESRHYTSQQAKFSRLKPLSDQGALELAVRYSTLDLNDQDVQGGSSEQISFGVNWYYKTQLRFMMNYILVNNDRYADADGDVAIEDKPKIFQLRAQADF